MSLIPGNIGTTPIQNIDTYGVEIKDNFISCEAVNIETQEIKTFHKEDCNFGYRESIFKQDAKGKYIITSVVFKLTKRHHNINIEYGDIKNQLASKHIENPKPHRAKLLHIRLFIKKQIEPAIAKSIITITKKTNNNRPSPAIIPKKIPKLLDISLNPIISPVLLT